MEGIRDSGSSGADRAAPEDSVSSAAGAVRRVDPVVERADELVAWLATTDGAGVEDAVRIDRIAALERAKGALAAAQVRQTVAFADSQRAGLPTWTPPRVAARSIGSQVALARGESPTRGDAHVALAQALAQSLPQTLAAMTAGAISEGAAESVYRAVEGMDPALMGQVDDRLAPELGTLGERSLGEAARRVANTVDDDAASRRVERAALSRRVTLRTAKDGMAYLTVLAPMAEAAGAFQAVEAEAAALRGDPGRAGTASRRSAFWLADSDTPAGPEACPSADPDGPTAHGMSAPARPDAAAEPGEELRHSGLPFFRLRPAGTRSRLMADVVISRLTGRAIGQPVPIEIQLVMTDRTLTGDTTNHDPTSHAATCGPTWPAPTFAPRTPPIHEARAGASASGAPVRAHVGSVPAGVPSPGRHEQERGDSGGHPGFTSTRAAERDTNGGAAPPAHPTAEGRAGPANAPAEGRAGLVNAPAERRARPANAPAQRRAWRGNPATSERWGGPAKIVGAGWLPAGFACELVRRTAAAGSAVTVRRVILGDDGTTVAGLEGRRHRLADPVRSTTPPVLAPTASPHRLFRGILRRLMVVRDQTCRTPFCTAAIRAADHITPARRDGPTCAHNAQGTCDRCNLTKEAPGWQVVVLTPPQTPEPDPNVPPWQQLLDALLADDQPPTPGPHTGAQRLSGHRTAVITPTGHIYRSTAPAVTERGRPGSAAG